MRRKTYTADELKEAIGKLREAQKTQIANLKKAMNKKVNILLGKDGKEDEIAKLIADVKKEIAEVENRFVKKIDDIKAKAIANKIDDDLYIAVGKAFIKLSKTKESITKADIVATLGARLKKKYNL